MLAIVIFVAFWVVLAGGLFLLGRSGATPIQRSSRARSTRAGRLAFNSSSSSTTSRSGSSMPVIILVGNHRKASTKISNINLTADEKRGRDLFGEHCAMCHTLAAANAVGKTGPNLDTLEPCEALILHTLANGCLQPPSPTISPRTASARERCPPTSSPASRPAGRAYVAKVAGRVGPFRPALAHPSPAPACRSPHRAISGGPGAIKPLPPDRW